MSRIQLKANGLWCTVLLCSVLLGMIAPTTSSVILSKITAQPSGSSSVASGNASLSATSTYTNFLSSSDPTFARPGGSSSSSSYHYNSIRVTTYTSGFYDFSSRSTISNPYGCLYSGSFDPYNPLINKLLCAGDSASLEFSFNSYLSASTTYILVVTSYSSYTTGSYTIIATGPESVSMTTVLPDFYPLAVGIIVAIVIGSIVGCALCVGLIIAIFVCLCRRSTVVHQTIIPAHYNPAPQAVYYPPQNPYGSQVKM